MMIAAFHFNKYCKIHLPFPMYWLKQRPKGKKEILPLGLCLTPRIQMKKAHHRTRNEFVTRLVISYGVS